MKKYMLSKEELSMYLACTLNTKREHAYWLGMSVEFPVDEDSSHIKTAVEKLFQRHPILNARFCVDENGEYYKYDCGEPVQFNEISPEESELSMEDHASACGQDPHAEIDPTTFYPVVSMDDGPRYHAYILTMPSKKILLLIIHHIVMDGTSRATLFRDLEAAYRGEDLGEPLMISYEVGEKEKEDEKLPRFEEDRQWYIKHLDGVENITPEPDVAEEQERFERFFYPMKGIPKDRIKEKKTKAGVRTSTIFLGACGYTMALFAGADESVIASAMSGRTDELKGACGMFVRTLPMISRIRPDRTVDAFLQDLDEQTTGGRDHSLFTYMDIAHELDMSLPVTFAYQGDMTSETMLFDGRELRVGNHRADESDYEMRLYLWRMNGDYLFELLYRADHYSREYMESVAETYQQVLTELLTKEKLSDIDPVSASQKERLKAFNQTEYKYEKESVVTQINRYVTETPDKTAVIFKDKKISYHELGDTADRIAKYLNNKGIKTEDVVSVLIPRCEYMAIASLGVLKSGAAYQPLDPSYPPERLAFMVEDAAAKLVIADRELLTQCIPDYDGEVLYLDEIPSLPACDSLNITPDLNDRFIMLYTSGSTGVPKGVILEHGNIICFVAWYKKTCEISSDSVVAAYASYGFDANMLDMYPTLTAGGTLVIIPEEKRLDFAAIKDCFDENRVTHSFMTTQVGRQFADYYTGDTLKYLSVGGEKLAPMLPEGKSFKFYNIYGPTECTVCVTAFLVDKKWHRIPIGNPLDNMKLYIVNPALKPLPIGAPGELLAGGPQVGRGYLNRPEKQAEVFIDNPFDKDETYRRCYRTGDIVRYLPDGKIDFVGRNDGQVKIRGFRIEMPEVENVIREFPKVKDVTVQAYDEPGGGKYIAAFVVAESPFEVSELNSFIQEKKPPYMVPAVTMFIDSIPLNQNQKVNKKALPEPEFTNTAVEDENREKTYLEEQIIEALKGALGDMEIGVSGSLKNYGLDSINAIRIVPMLKARFGVEIPVTELLDGMSVTEIENRIAMNWSRIFNGGESGGKGTGRRNDVDEAGLSSVQLGVYYDEAKRGGGECLYNIPMCYVFDNVDAVKLKEAVETVILAHENLSTRMAMKNGQLVQIRTKEDPEVEFLSMSEEECQSYLEQFVRPFSATRDRLYRFSVVKTDEKTYLVQDIHHLVFDGISSAILIGEIGKAYRGEEIEPEDYDYFDYVLDESAAKENGAYDASKEYFDKMFSSYEEPASIPTDLSGQESEGRIGYAEVSLPKDEIVKTAKSLGVTPSSIFLAATFYTASRFATTDKVYLSTISSGRDGLHTNRSIGMFVHTIPLFMDFEKDKSTEALIIGADEVMRESIRHEDYPFAEICAAYGYKTELMYEYQVGVASDQSQGDDFSYERRSLMLEQPKFKTTVYITEAEGRFKIGIRYNDELYSRESMDLLARSLKNVTTAMIHDTATSVKSISMMDEELAGQVRGFGLSKHVELKTELLHRLLEETVEACPDRKAVIACDGTLTFDELNSHANRIAHELIERGVSRGDSVVLLLPRRSYYFAVMFGVLKTGAAFIPCDPEYPAERIAHILSDSDGKYIITTDEHASEHARDKVIVVDTLLSEGTDPGNPDVEVSPTDLAYMIYTSGSTGKPKGVELMHRGIVNYMLPDETSPFFYYVKNEMDTIISVTTVSFDMSFKDTVGILCNGKTVVFTSEEEMNDPRELARLLSETGADAFSATPSRLRQYMAYEPFTEALKKCRLVICGGEAYPKTLLKELQSIGGLRIMNSYGPTEITVSSNMAELTDAKEISIGKPLPNYDEFIVDDDLNPVPAGVIGELLIGGPGVARGYRGLSEMTQKSFIEYEGQRVYRSGDYAKWDFEGNVRILGRKDNQVKLRGLRIELGEIEGLIAEQEGIGKAVVVIRKLNGQDNLCAYFTADHEIDISGLREALQAKLTHYMVPTAYLQMDEIPVTPNGKTDVKNLPEPEAVERGEYVEPVGEVESFFCQVFEDVLKLDRVGATDDFFELGGTSLVVTGVVIAAQDKGYTLGYGDVFKYTTPRSLARIFTAGESEESGEDATFEKYDYSKINQRLEQNNLASFVDGESREIGNIFLTGATGYMGVHVLAEFLRNEKGKAYCLVRKGRYDSSMKRLANTMFYYFDREFVELLQTRVEAVDGDVTSFDVFESLKDEPIDTVFNCAASVKHFSSGTDIEDINVGGTVNCIRFCEETGARLIHFSTTSVGGHMIVPAGHKPPVLEENSFYYGQILDNQYTVSKMLAEREVMEAVAERRLDAKIIRVGTLAARESDGEFQINMTTNSFMGRLRSYEMLGCFPYSMINQSLRMGPIDTSAHAFFLLARTPKECCLFHAINNNVVPMIHVIRQMQQSGMNIRLVDDCEFDKAMEEAEKEPEKAEILQSILAYKNLGGAKAVPVAATCEYTSQVLARMGFFWNATVETYIHQFIDALNGLGFFDEDFLTR